MKLRHLLQLLPAVVSFAADEPPRKDPFLAPDAEIAAMIPRGENSVRQVSVQLDWIKLPHLTANQLLRRHLQHSTEGDALYAVVQELITQKKAERLDLNAVLVRGGQRSKVEATVETAYATEFDPPQVNDRITVGGETVRENISPVTPNSFTFRNVGHTVEVEATVSANGRIIDLNLAAEWVEHLTDWSWGTGVSEIKQPVFGTDKLSNQMLCGNGEWELAGLFTPPWLPEAGKPPGCAPLPADRVFLFVRGTTDQKPKENPPQPVNGVKQVTVLAEWIETDTATASALLAQHPAFADSTPLREALEPMITDGRATLLESTALPIRGGQRSRIESITEFPCPTENDPPQGANTVFGQAPVQPVPQTPRGAMVAPACPNSFSFRSLGTTMEIEASVGEDGFTIDLNCSPELIFLTGFNSHGQGLSEMKQPHFQSLKTTCQLLVPPGAPSMIAAFDAPLTDTKPQPHARARKVLLFIRAIL